MNHEPKINFHLGCAVWSYKGWVGDVYPPKSRISDFLSLYSRYFNAVEGNTTFYATPDSSTVKRWAEQTPSGFKFCPKFPQEVTHRGLLQPSIPKALEFLKIIAKLGDRLGVVFAQLPPSYSPESLSDLQEFLSICTQNFTCSLALEVRHLDWFREPYCSELNEILESFGIGKVLLDTRPIYNSTDDPQINSRRRKPQLPLQPIVTADFTIIRFISHPQQLENEAFIREWVDLLPEWLNRGKTVYFFVHCPIEEHSPHTARYIHQQLATTSVDIPNLPWTQLEPIPTQLSLF
jgi:uncharacterized protein YecE (DUF72 family)